MSSVRLDTEKHVNAAPDAKTPRIGARIISIHVDATSYETATKTILAWASTGESRYVCVSTVHMVMEAFDSEEYRAVVNAADLVTPDGMPLVWTLCLLGRVGQRRVYGPDLTVKLLSAAARNGVPVGFYGGRPEVMERLLSVVYERFPELNVTYAASPPFQSATESAREKTIAAISSSGTRILFVGLGCPKQERWMAAHRGQVNAVMIGVGAAFDFLAGTIPQAPRWIMAIGLEWLFRLLIEPRRLWRRYLKNNPRFMFLLLIQQLKPRYTQYSKDHSCKK